MGQVNAITKEEAQAADFVLIASDQILKVWTVLKVNQLFVSILLLVLRHLKQF